MLRVSHRMILGSVVLLMLGTSPMTVIYSYSDEEDLKLQKSEDFGKKEQKERVVKVIFTENVVNGKLQLRHYVLAEDTSSRDIQRILSFEGENNKWGYTIHNGYQSGIVLFDGKTSKINENLWKISNETMNLVEKDRKLEVQHHDSHLKLNETTSNEEFSYKVVFSGKMVESNVDINFVISFMNSSLANLEMGENLKFQDREFIPNSEKSMDFPKMPEFNL